jgi:hypothetical protein
MLRTYRTEFLAERLISTQDGRFEKQNKKNKKNARSRAPNVGVFRVQGTSHTIAHGEGSEKGTGGLWARGTHKAAFREAFEFEVFLFFFGGWEIRRSQGRVVCSLACKWYPS